MLAPSTGVAPPCVPRSSYEEMAARSQLPGYRAAIRLAIRAGRVRVRPMPGVTGRIEVFPAYPCETAGSVDKRRVRRAEGGNST